MTKQLDKLDIAARAVAEAKTVPEVKEWRDKAVAMMHWAKRAKHKQILQDAIDIKMDAERKGGQLLIKMAEDGERAVRKNMKSQRATSKLSDLGINKTESHRWQAIARLPAAKWESRKRHVKGIAVATLEGHTEIVKAARAERHRAKKKRRAQREKDLADKQKALPQKKYGVILADPEWRWEAWSEKGLDATSADNQYPTSNLETIKLREVNKIAADDCVLWLWATVPMTPHALEVMAAWGFKYVSQFAWVKDKAGTGYWNRNKHELLLIGTRGKIPAPAEGTQWESVIEAPRGKHSEKPEKSYELIEHYFPNLPKVELNARKTRKGWDSWGLEAPVAEAAE